MTSVPPSINISGWNFWKLSANTKPKCCHLLRRGAFVGFRLSPSTATAHVCNGIPAPRPDLIPVTWVTRFLIGSVAVCWWENHSWVESGRPMWSMGKMATVFVNPFISFYHVHIFKTECVSKTVYTFGLLSGKMHSITLKFMNTFLIQCSPTKLHSTTGKFCRHSETWFKICNFHFKI